MVTGQKKESFDEKRPSDVISLSLEFSNINYSLQGVTKKVEIQPYFRQTNANFHPP